MSYKCDSKKSPSKGLLYKLKREGSNIRSGLTNTTLSQRQIGNSGMEDQQSDIIERHSCWICQEEMSSESLLLQHYENHMRHVADDCAEVWQTLRSVNFFPSFNFLTKRWTKQFLPSAKGFFFNFSNLLKRRLLSWAEPIYMRVGYVSESRRILFAHTDCFLLFPQCGAWSQSKCDETILTLVIFRPSRSGGD